MKEKGQTDLCGRESIRKKETPHLDLTGMRAGRLIAIEPTDRRDSKGSVVWRCKCDCGNTAEVTADSLMHGNTRSCGCRKREILDTVGDNLTFVSDTCVEWIRSRKSRRDNKSGFRGVQKYKGKYRVSIGFQRKRYHCGTYDSFEEAKAARLEAEGMLHDDFVRAWDKWSAEAERDKSWAQRFPFIFDVVKENGKFKVYAPILEET